MSERDLSGTWFTVSVSGTLEKCNVRACSEAGLGLPVSVSGTLEKCNVRACSERDLVYR